MLSVLLTIGALAIVGIVGPLVAMATESTYGSELENYIVSNNPKDTGDVERLTREYDQDASKRFL
jgi:hypothetical protein